MRELPARVARCQYACMPDRILPAWTGRQWLLAVAAVAVAVDLAAAATQVGTFARIGWTNLSPPDRLVRDADLDPFAYFFPTGPIVGAQRVIPRDATYAIRADKASNPEIVADVFRLLLLPRTYTTRLSDAQWVIAYHRSSELLGVPYTEEIGIGPNVNVVKVKR